MRQRVWLGFCCVLPAVISAAFGCQSGNEDEVTTSGGANTGGKSAAGEAGAESGSGGKASSGGSTPTGGNPSSGGTVGGMGGEGGSGGAPAECPALSGPGTAVPPLIEGQEVWTREGSPYVVDANVIITGSVEIQECVALLFAPGAGLDVRGSLTAHGTMEEDTDGALLLSPVLFLPKEDGAPWGQISVSETGLLDLEVAGLLQGGSTGSVIRAYGADQYGLPHRSLRTVGVGIYDSAGVAVELTSRTGFTEDSADLLIDAAGREDRPFPISIEAGALSSLPALLTLENNAHDEIFVDVFRQVHEDTIKNLGYPYHVEGPIYVYHENGVPQAEPSRLVIEPGVTLRMAESAGSGLIIGGNVGNEAILVAEGTEDEPIRFESAEATPAPGDWMGLTFRSPVIPGNSLRHVQIAHAGGESATNSFGCGPRDNDASILILSDAPVAPFVESCAIEQAGGMNQIVLGWVDDPDPAGVASEVASKNSFDPSGPSCQVSSPQADAIPSCPDLAGAYACF